MDFPKTLDLFDWTDYGIFRSLLSKPFPSPRVWDNAGSLGFSGGNYNKDIFFDKDFFVNDLNSKTRDKYGGEIKERNLSGPLMKADRSSHTFYETKDNHHMYLNFDNFLVSQNISFDFDYQELRDTIRDIYYLVRVGSPAIDSGYVAPSGVLKYNEYPNSYESLWIKLNKTFASELNKDKDISVEFLYENISSIFSCSHEKLLQINRVLKNEHWFLNMFNYSFRDRFLKNIYSSKKQVIVNPPNYEDGDFEIIKDGDIQIIKNENKKIEEKNSSLDNLHKNSNQENLSFIPSEAKIPDGFKSMGDEVKDLEFALSNPDISFRSFFNDCEFLKDGIWKEETLFCEAFNEELYCQLIREYHRYSIAELNSRKAEEMKKAERKGAGIGGLFGLLTGGIMAPITAAMGANVGKMISNNVDETKPLKHFLPDPQLVFLKDSGSFLSLSKIYRSRSTKRRIVLKKRSLDNDNIYFDLIPMIVFDDWVTPAQIFKLDNSYYLRPISANYDTNNEFNLQYNPIKFRRSYSYNPIKGPDIEKLAKVMTTKIIGETIEKSPTIFFVWLRDNESFNHFYFDYSTDGTIF